MEAHLSDSGAEELLPVGPFAGANPVIIGEEIMPDGEWGNRKTPGDGDGDGAIPIDVVVDGGPVKLGITCKPGHCGWSEVNKEVRIVPLRKPL